MLKQQGFTLIELILTTIIVGILAIVIVPSFGDNYQYADQAKKVNHAGADVHYVICKDWDGVVHQESGVKIHTDGRLVVVTKADGTKRFFANMQCWTETETITTSPNKGEEGNET